MRAYPLTLTQALRDAMVPTAEYVRKLAHLFRLNGHAINFREQDERVFVIDQHIRLVIEHGDKWDVAAVMLYKNLATSAKTRITNLEKN